MAGPIADHLISEGWRIGVVRKLAQCTAFLGPSLCLLAASYPPFATKNLIFLTAALGLSSFSLAGGWARRSDGIEFCASGLYCNHQDLSPRYSSFLLGITNTAGAMPGILGQHNASLNLIKVFVCRCCSNRGIVGSYWIVVSRIVHSIDLLLRYRIYHLYTLWKWRRGRL